MPKFYAVEVRTVAVIQVEDDEDDIMAETIADSEVTDIVTDAKHNAMEFNSMGEIKNLKDLQQYDWDGKCIPYGGDGNTRLEDLLPAE